MFALNPTPQLWTKCIGRERASDALSDPGDDGDDGPDHPTCCWNLCPTISSVKAPRPAVPSQARARS